jgi:5,10-methylenetetrahydromethanopterin reductase
MRFGFHLSPRDIHAIGPIASLGEEQGFDVFAVGDVPSLSFDPFIALALAAIRTRRVRIGPTVTNTQTRHPLVLANLAATLDQLAPGRAFLGVGTGNSSVHHAGVRAATLEELAGTMDVIRRLLSGEAVESGNTKMTIKSSGRRVPILLAASGPKSLRLGGRVADIVLMNIGVSPEIVAEGMRWIREGAAAAGRNPDSVEVWVEVPLSISLDRAQAVDDAKIVAAGIASYALRGDATAKRIPPAIQEKTGEFLRNYQYAEHLTPGRTSNYHLADRLGIADYLVDRFTVAGTPEDCLRKLASLQAIGVERVHFSVSGSPDRESSVRLLGKTVVPALAG